MNTVPERSRVRLPDISSRAYEHPADRSALVALRKLTGFDAILRNIAGLFGDRSLRLLFLASSVRASEQQFPHLYQMMLDGAYVLDLPRVPELFITQDPMVNAMTIGTDKPFIVMTTGLVDLMDEEEARFVVGHELGHVLSGHSVYRTMLYALVALAARFAVVPIAWIGLKAVIWGLEEWYRKSELSCDRAGLLACQDVPAARRALMKTAGGPQLAELSADAFLEQAREYDAVPDVRESLIKLMQMQGQTHPFAVVRFAELDRWANEGEYRDILAGNYPRRDNDRDASVGDEFKSASKSYQDSWNRSADPLIGAVRGVAGSAVGAGERLMNRFGRRDNDSSSDDTGE
ncbi:MAG TPA: M48 family metallopeptidase [Streptosporangiaceae bacterium]|jgi:Zn-dependent protease with chaperone function|nr:M48 family metallopeptidase [Streptosporangiaceae bacterium]